MDETQSPQFRSRNWNLLLQSHKSVPFNQINSTRIVPRLYSSKDKTERSPDENKESNNINPISTSKYVNTFNKKSPIMHSYSIRQPATSNRLFKSNKNNINDMNKEEELKLSDTKNDNYPSNRLNNRNITSLMKNMMTPKKKIQIKRINTINVNDRYNTNLYNNKNNDFPFDLRNSVINKNKIQNYDFSRMIKRKSTIVKNSDIDDKTNLYLRTLYAKNYKKKPPKIVNPLQIPDEDKIFDEMKRYLCYKYERRRLKTYNNQRDNDEKKNQESKLKKLKPKLKTADKKRLNYLYLSTNKISNKIYKIKRRKSRKDLMTYQKNLLEIIKPSLTDYSFMYLKNRFVDIRKKNEKKYQNNYRKLKEIESEEKDIIYQFNETCENYLKKFKKMKEEKELSHPANLDIKLPTMTFVSCLKKNKDKDKYQKKKSKIRIRYFKRNKNNNNN